jgi:hypothetical protein
MINMKTIAFLFIVYIVFFVLSIYFRNRMIRIKSRWLYLFIPCYLIAIYYYFEFINQLSHFLMDKKIYLELGHANYYLLVIYLISIVTAIIFIFSIFYKRKKTDGR